jgi:large subunit ribosomal protein L15
MELHKLEIANGSRKSVKRLGRGNASGTGTTAGRGTKGQKSRSGGRIRRGFEGGQMPLYRRIPKRGFNNVNRKQYAIVPVSALEQIFKAGDTITPQEIRESGLVSKVFDGIKILGNGEITKSLHVKANRFSQSAAEKIRAAGGTVEELK